MNDKRSEFLRKLGIDPKEFDQVEVEKTEIIYRSVKCKEHNGKEFSCIPCIQQNRGLKQRRVVHIA